MDKDNLLDRLWATIEEIKQNPSNLETWAETKRMLNASTISLWHIIIFRSRTETIKTTKEFLKIDKKLSQLIDIEKNPEATPEFLIGYVAGILNILETAYELSIPFELVEELKSPAMQEIKEFLLFITEQENGLSMSEEDFIATTERYKKNIQWLSQQDLIRGSRTLGYIYFSISALGKRVINELKKI